MIDIAKWFRAPEKKSSHTAQLVAFQSQGRARWTPRDIASLAREGYMKNAIVHRGEAAGRSGGAGGLARL